MKQKLSATGIVLLVLSFSGCSRYVSWGKEIFDQGRQPKTPIAVVKPYVRDVHTYDQFTTLGNFDAMWLADPVRRAYAQTYARKRGYTREQYAAFLDSQLAENDTLISFYLLAVVGGFGITDLDDKNSLWSIQLRIGNEYFTPVKIEPIEQLPAEYQFFFGKHWTMFKSQYLISFNALDEDGDPLLRRSLTSIALIFRRVGHETAIVWPLDGNSHIMPRCGLNSDVLLYDLYENI